MLTFSLNEWTQKDNKAKYWLHGGVLLLLYPLLHHIRLLYWKYQNASSAYSGAAFERLSIIGIFVFIGCMKKS